MRAFRSEAKIAQPFKVQDGGDTGQQRDVLCLVECAAPGELGRHGQLEVLCQAVTDTRDLAASPAIIKSLHDCARLLVLGRNVHRAARSMTAATSAGWEM